MGSGGLGGWSHGEVGVGGWSGVEGVRVGVGGDAVGFGGVQVRRLGSGRSEGLWGLGSKGLGEFGSKVGLGLGNSEGCGIGVGVSGGLGSRVGFERLGSGELGEMESGGLGLDRKIGIREVGVAGELGSGGNWGWGS